MSRGGAAPAIRPLSSDDQLALEGFRCAAGIREPWADAVEYLVSRVLPGAIARGDVEALGMIEADELVGVVAWSQTDWNVWRVNPLAVRRNRHRRGYGRALKCAVLDLARESGIALVVSEVHEDNTAMLMLNRQLRADMRPIVTDPYGRERHFACTIKP